MRDALGEIASNLCSVHRYLNMKSFPVVVMMAKKAANRAAEALGQHEPFDNVHEI